MSTLDLAAFGAVIRARRKSMDLTQAELGERVGLGQTSISAIEVGRVNTPIQTLVAILDALGVRGEERAAILAGGAS